MAARRAHQGRGGPGARAMAEKQGASTSWVVEGAIPTGINGAFCKIGGQTAIEMVKECAADAAAVIAIGSCASWGGMPSTSPPTRPGASPVAEILGKPVLNIPRLSAPTPYNFLTTVVHYLVLGALPELDAKGRPTFAYGRLIHENCERRAHFDAGRFATEFGDEGPPPGAGGLYKLGCKGPETLRQLPDRPCSADAGAGLVAGRLRSPVHRLHREGRRLHQGRSTPWPTS
jgi:hydrogenase small subunit